MVKQLDNGNNRKAHTEPHKTPSSPEKLQPTSFHISSNLCVVGIPQKYLQIFIKKMNAGQIWIGTFIIAIFSLAYVRIASSRTESSSSRTPSLTQQGVADCLSNVKQENFPRYFFSKTIFLNASWKIGLTLWFFWKALNLANLSYLIDYQAEVFPLLQCVTARVVVAGWRSLDALECAGLGKHLILLQLILQDATIYLETLLLLPCDNIVAVIQSFLCTAPVQHDSLQLFWEL